MTDIATFKFIDGYNKQMAEIIAEANAEKLTLGRIFRGIINRNNVVKEYLDNNVDLFALNLALEKMIEEEDQHSNIEDQTKEMLKNMVDLQDDRYLTELSFITGAFQYRSSDTFLKKLISSFMSFEHFKEDLIAMLPSRPNVVWDESNSSILEAFGRNMTELAKIGELHKIVDRDEEVHKIVRILTRQTKSNPVLVGPAGVGKTAIVEKLAYLFLDKKEIPQSLHDFKIFELNMAAVISAGSAQPGALENLIMDIIETAKKENAVLFIDEIHIIGTYQQGKIANLLKPAMARGDIKLIGATTDDEYKVFEKDKAMLRRFQPVKINEPDKVSVYHILKERSKEIEKYFDVIIPGETLLKAISLSEQYITTRKQPDKAIDLIEEASSKLRMILEAKPQVIIELEQKLGDAKLKREMLRIRTGETPSDREQIKLSKIEEDIEKYTSEIEKYNELYQEQRTFYDRMINIKEELEVLEEEYRIALFEGNFQKAAELSTDVMPAKEEELHQVEKQLIEFAEKADEKLVQNVVVPDMVARIIEEMTGIPTSAQGEEDIEKYKNIAIELKKTVHGQDKAIDAFSAAIKRSKAGFHDKNKPLGSFLCLGPTGVGKTYLAQELAKFMFDTDKVLRRFDMSEYMEPHSVARLFGSPPGYVGHDEGGQLTEAIKRNPYSIILFDEIEKAHKRVFDALLQILDAGRMTDGQGEVVDFKNTIIIMTSNIGSEIIREGLENNYDPDIIESALFEEIKKHFRPEFLNRFDAKVMFNSLAPDVVEKIAETELRKLAEKLSEENDYEIYWHPDVPAFITQKRYSVVDGARPIKRYINETIINQLTDKTLNREIIPGDIIYIRVENDELILIPMDEETLKEVQKEEKKTMETSKVLKTGHGSKITMAQKEPKKKKKKKKKEDWKSNTFKLDTKLGD